jgi:hypothetical protein
VPAARLAEDAVLNRAPDVIAVHVGETLVLHETTADAYMRLNDSAAVVWTKLSTPSSPRELAVELARRYDLPPDRALRDVERLISALLERRALIVSAT